MPGKDALKAGLTHSETIIVPKEMTVPEISPLFKSLSAMPPVFDTAHLVAFVEWTCLELVLPYLEEGERTLGTAMNVHHTAATPMGMKVTAEVALIAVHGRMLSFTFICHDEKEQIAEGLHERAIIDYERFAAKLEKKK